MKNLSLFRQKIGLKISFITRVYGVILPLAPAPPPYLSTSLKRLCLGRWFIQWSAEVSHISLWPQEIQSREWEKKNEEQTNNMGLVNSKCNKGKFVTLHFLCICRLSLTCSFRKISTRLLGMPTHLWPSSSLLTVVDSGLRTHLVCLPHCPWTLSHPTGLFCCPFSTAPLRHPLRTAFSGFIFPTAFSVVPLPISLASLGSAFFPPLQVSLEISILSPLFGFVPRQSKGSSA